jgi:hypothetical protein
VTEPPLTLPVGVAAAVSEPLQRWARAARSVVPGARHVTLRGLGSEMAFEEPRRGADLVMAFTRGINEEGLDEEVARPPVPRANAAHP